MLERLVAERLERGAAVLPFAAHVARGWAAVAGTRLTRPLDTSSLACPVITVGGSTLGGSGKTPLVAAIARHLAERGARVTILGHGHRASPGRARQVHPGDEARVVGDEALLLCRELGGLGVQVVVAPTRAGAVAWTRASVGRDPGRTDVANTGLRVALFDGVAQTHPRRADLALLAVDGHAPFGAGRAPPAGDLRAPWSALVAAADRVVRVVDPLDPPSAELEVPADDAVVVSRGAWSEGTLLPWTALGRFGLLTSIARPGRILRFLAARGIHPRAALASADHVAPSSRLVREARATARRLGLEGWICTAKCAVHLSGRRHLLGAPIATLEYALAPGPALAAALASVRATNPLS